MAKLNVFFKWLKLKNYIKENPLKDIKKPSVRYVDFRRVDDNDIHKLYSSVVLNPINNLLSARDNMMISLLINCGLRKGEFISLRVDDVDLINKE
jgi:integrase